MRKKIMCLAMAAVMAVGMGITAQAKDYQGKDGWKVEFTNEDMKSNFKSSDITDEVENVQPGDSITLKVGLQNTSSADADWYMTNEVLQTLEDAKSQAYGGGYEYRLSFVDQSGKENVLYDSETVGGEEESAAGEGLHEATDSLEDYFYLARMGKGETGTVNLRLAVDGETQGNGYQTTFAALQMNFAAEEVLVDTTQDRVIRKTVKTGDTNKVLLLCALTLFSGLVLLFFGLKSMKNKRRENQADRRKGE